MTYRRNEPYNDLPLLPPRQEIETVPVLRQLVIASRALATLKGAGNLIPNQAILINAIPLQEAKASSEIENIVTTQDALYRAVIEIDGGRVDPHTREVLRYRQALRYGYDALRQGQRISIDLMIESCSSLLNEVAVLRDQQPIIIEDRGANEIVYTPPRDRQVILRLLRNLVDFLSEPGGLDPLLKMAVAHYQFEAIHPFVDGNGRTGRIINLLFLVQEGLLDIPVLYLSRYIIQNKAEYYRRLRAVTEAGDWQGWLLFMLVGIEETATWTYERIVLIRDLLEQTTEFCRENMSKGYSRELIEAIFYHPYCKIGFLIEAGIAERQTASVYLRELEAIGILTSEKRGREVIYKNPALLDILSL